MSEQSVVVSSETRKLAELTARKLREYKINATAGEVIPIELLAVKAGTHGSTWIAGNANPALEIMAYTTRQISIEQCSKIQTAFLKSVDHALENNNETSCEGGGNKP